MAWMAYALRLKRPNSSGWKPDTKQSKNGSAETGGSVFAQALFATLRKAVGKYSRTGYGVQLYGQFIEYGQKRSRVFYGYT